MTSPFDPHAVEVLAAALPTTGDNPIGRAARSVLSTHLKRSTPGNYSQMFGTGPAFREIFFKNTQTSPHENMIEPLTGLGNDFFTAAAVASVCQQIGLSTSRLRPHILMDSINNDLNTWNARLTTSSYRFYAFMVGVVDGPIQSALSTFPDPGSKQTAKEHYLAGITSEAWVTAKKIQDASGQWFDRDWELFHHWIKLTALGAEAGEIDNAITTIITMGLPIPTNLGPQQWRQAHPWFGPGLGAADTSEAVGPILETRCHTYIDGSYSCMSEDNSYEFTANSQPGNKYRKLPETSCFSPGTRVAVADGTTRPIEQVVPGDVVATSSGPRTVLLRIETTRGQRTLRRFAGHEFAFSATHPFVVWPHSSSSGYYSADDPAALARAVPMLSTFGISPLRPPDGAGYGTQLIRHTPDGGVRWPVPKVHSDPDTRPDLLYDLIVEFDDDGRSEYYAGDEQLQVLVSSEIPRFGAAPEAAWVLLHILQLVTPTILDVLTAVPDESFEDLVNIGLTSLSRTLLPVIGPRLSHKDSGSRTPSPLQAAQDLARSLTQPSGTNIQRPTIVFEQLLTALAPQIQATLAMGWRSFDLVAADVANLLVVDLYGVELFQEIDGSAPSFIELAIANSATQRYARWIPVTSGEKSTWYLSSDEPGYFPEWGQLQPLPTSWTSPLTEPLPSNSSMTPLWELQIQLAPWTSATARLPLPATIAHGYEAFDAPLVNPHGTVVGCARGNLRLLTTEGFAAEWQAHQAWEPRNRENITQQLAQLSAQYITDRFAAAISTFRYCAATTSKPETPAH